MDFITIIQLLDSTLRLATPLLLACLAGLFSERSGIFDIGLEGKMLIAAFFSAAIAATTGSVWIGLLAGISASLVLALLHGVASITFRGDQLISGVAINFLAAGITVLIAQDWFAQGGRTPGLSGDARFQPWNWPGAEALKDAAIIGPVYSDLVSGHTMLVYVALLAVPLSWYVLFRTRFGLRLRAVGENPAAVDTAGISVIRLRFTAVLICGLLCGLAGAYLATGLAAGFVKDMAAGRGFIALAALIFAKWRPWSALGACLLFGLLQAIGTRFENIDALTFAGLCLLIACAAIALVVVLRAILAAQGRASREDVLGAVKGLAIVLVIAAATGLLSQVAPGIFDWTIPSQFMQALPYILTVVILAGFVGKAIPPRAGGAPYVKER